MAAAVSAFADHGFASFDIVKTLWSEACFPAQNAHMGLRFTLEFLMSAFLALGTPF